MTDEAGDQYFYDYNTGTFEDFSGYELDFAISDIMVDAKGTVYQFDKRPESDTFGKYVDSDLDEISGRDSIVEITSDYAMHVLEQSANTGLDRPDADTMSDILESVKGENQFMKIKFTFSEDIINSDFVDFYSNTETGYYHFPDASNSELTLSRSPFNIIYAPKIGTADNSYLRDFVLLSRLIEYFSRKTKSEVSTVKSPENTQNLILFKECRVNPLLWTYVYDVHELFRQNLAGNYVTNHTIYTGNKPIESTFTLGQFLKANYYDVSQTTRDTNERLVQALYLGTGNKFPTLFTSMPA
jgi:hypothetical protein